MLAEKECVNVRKECASKCETLEMRIMAWEKEYACQQLKSERLREHLSRTERELYGILQRKYEFMRGTPSGARFTNSQRGSFDGVEMKGIRSVYGSNEHSNSTSEDYLNSRQVLLHFLSPGSQSNS